MTSVKWLERIEVLDEPFGGYQQADSYRVRSDEDEPVAGHADPPRALMVPPGIPDYMTRERSLAAGAASSKGARGRGGPRSRRGVHADGGARWAAAVLASPPATGVALWRRLGRRCRASYERAAARATRPAPSSPSRGLERRRLREHARAARTRHGHGVARFHPRRATCRRCAPSPCSGLLACIAALATRARAVRRRQRRVSGSTAGRASPRARADHGTTRPRAHVSQAGSCRRDALRVPHRRAQVGSG